jgi:hypothetical protein
MEADMRLILAVFGLFGLASCGTDPSRVCDGNRVVWSADGEVLQECAASEVCRARESGEAECGLDVPACKADGVQLCHDGSLVLCRGAGFAIVLQSCGGEKMTCISGIDRAYCGYPDILCPKGSFQTCAGDRLARCGTDGVAIQVLPCDEKGQTCLAYPGGAECAFADRPCTPGVNHCSGTGIALCGPSGHVYHVNPCDPGCADGEAGAECADLSLPCTTPGRDFCQDARHPATCGRNGYVTELRTCDPGLSCVTDGTVVDCGLPDRPCAAKGRHFCKDAHEMALCSESGFTVLDGLKCEEGTACVDNGKDVFCLLTDHPCERWLSCSGNQVVHCLPDMGFAAFVWDCHPGQQCFDDGMCGMCALPDAQPCQKDYCDGPTTLVQCNECGRVSGRQVCKKSCSVCEEHGATCDHE